MTRKKVTFKTYPSKEKWIGYLGFMLVLFGMLSNGYLLGYFFTKLGIIKSPIVNFSILTANIAFIVCGSLIVWHRTKPYAVNILLTVFGCLLLAGTVFLSIKAVNLFVFANPHIQLTGPSIHRVQTNKKVVALTFDDGPYPPYTNQLLDVLDEFDVKATFFMVGYRMEQYPETAKLVLSKGHELANHTYTHPIMVFQSEEFMRSQINKTNRILKNLGVKNRTLFRAPEGKKFIVLPRVLKDMGMKHILYDVDPGDWRQKEADEVLEYVIDHVKPGSIVVLHDGYPAGLRIAQATRMIIEELHARGYKIVSVSKLLTYQTKK